MHVEKPPCVFQSMSPRAVPRSLHWVVVIAALLQSVSRSTCCFNCTHTVLFPCRYLSGSLLDRPRRYVRTFFECIVACRQCSSRRAAQLDWRASCMGCVARGL
jgi:hypothetical protein